MDKQERIDQLNGISEINARMGGDAKVAKQHELGRLTARERIGKLFDPGTFEEYGTLFTVKDADGELTHVNVVSGFGEIGGRTANARADDATVDSPGLVSGRQPLTRGDYPKYHAENRYPQISLVDGGSDDNWMDMGPRRARGGFFFGSPGPSSNRGVPHVAAIMGNCIGAGAIEAISSDFVVQVKGTRMGLFDPRMQAPNHEREIDTEGIGQWQTNLEVTGQVDAVADDDEHAIEIIREFLSYLPLNWDEEPPVVPTDDPPDRRCDKLMAIIPDATNRAYDQHQVIKQIVDDGKFFRIKHGFGKAIITGLARMNGRSVGIIANQTMHTAGAAGPDECDKATDLIVLCDMFNIPLLFLDDVPGHLVGRLAEKKRMPTKIMLWMEAMGFASVPRISIVIRKAYGMAISNMCGSNSGPDVFSAMTTAEFSFMSPAAAANVVYSKRIEAAEDPEAERAKLIKEIETESSPFAAAAAGLLDDIIDPRDTRKYIIDKFEFLRRAGKDFIGEHALATWPRRF